MTRLPTEKRLLDWASAGIDRYERLLSEQQHAAPTQRAVWMAWRDAYAVFHLELCQRLPRLIEEARLLPEPESEERQWEAVA